MARPATLSMFVETLPSLQPLPCTYSLFGRHLFNTFELSTRGRVENKEDIILAFMELSINDNK